MISWLRAVSRLPVGSSASSTAGSVTMARAMATRCCWPPESSPGVWVSHAAQPHDRQGLAWPVAPFSEAAAAIEQGQLHVLQGRGAVQEVDSPGRRNRVVAAQQGALVAGSCPTSTPWKR